jgi:hypothetical protein
MSHGDPILEPLPFVYSTFVLQNHFCYPFISVQVLYDLNLLSKKDKQPVASSVHKPVKIESHCVLQQLTRISSKISFDGVL